MLSKLKSLVLIFFFDGVNRWDVVVLVVEEVIILQSEDDENGELDIFR